MTSNISNSRMPESKTGLKGISLNYHVAQKMKEEQKAVDQEDSKPTEDSQTKKEATDWGTHPTVGIETISEDNTDFFNDKVNLDIKQENQDAQSENCQKNELQDEMSVFLKEVNTINEKLFNRKATIRERMTKLNQELDLLKDSQTTPKAFFEYIMKQRGLREMVKYSLKTGSTNFDPNMVKDEVDTLGHNYQDLFRHPENTSPKVPHEAVFVTEKTLGYRKEKELEEQMLNGKKRDQKAMNKAYNPEIVPSYEYDPYYGNFDAPIPDFYNQGYNTYAYPSRGMYEYENYPLHPYDDWFYNKEFNESAQVTIPNDKDGDQRMLYPSQNPALAYSNPLNPCDDLQKCADKNKDVSHQRTDKVQKDPVPAFDDFFKGNEELIKPDELKQEKNIKKELDSDSDLFLSQNGDGKKNDEIDMDGIDEDIFENSNSSQDFSYEDKFNDNLGADKIEDPFEENKDETKQDDDNTKDMDNDQIQNLNNHYMPHPDHMGMYMDLHDPMNVQAYGQSPYMMEQMMKSHMYNEHMYPPSHSLIHMQPYMKGEGDMAGYMHMAHPEDVEYFLQQKHIKEESKHKNAPGKGRKRNKYKMLPTDLKHRAVTLALQKTPKFSANFYAVPLKSLKRWMKVGCERKKGGGRKTKDPLMEKNLYAWYVDKKAQGELVTAKMIKEKAIQLTNCSDFIASKGWLDKFKVRFNLEISKESAKDSHKRRNTNDPRRRGVSRVNYPQEDDFLGMEMANFQSCRRSLNKSIKQETHENPYKQEGIGSIFAQPNNISWNQQPPRNIKNEDWRQHNQPEESARPPAGVASIFSGTQFSTQLPRQSLIERTTTKNVISLPLCENDNIGDRFTNS